MSPDECSADRRIECEAVDFSAEVEVKAALANAASERLTVLLDGLTINEALRELLNFTPTERDTLISLLSADLASRLIEKAPIELAGELLERLETDKAVEIFDELASELQADVISKFDKEDTEAILAGIDAAGVRRLADYPSDSPGGLMLADAFTFRREPAVGAVLRSLASDDEDLTFLAFRAWISMRF